MHLSQLAGQENQFHKNEQFIYIHTYLGDETEMLY